MLDVTEADRKKALPSNPDAGSGESRPLTLTRWAVRDLAQTGPGATGTVSAPICSGGRSYDGIIVAPQQSGTRKCFAKLSHTSKVGD